MRKRLHTGGGGGPRSNPTMAELIDQIADRVYLGDEEEPGEEESPSELDF